MGLGLAITALPAPSIAAVSADVGPRTVAVDLNAYALVRYVDQTRGDDIGGDGSREKPWASLPHALEHLRPPADGRRLALLVSAGRYVQPTFALKSRVDLYGGYAAPGGERDVWKHATILDGEEGRRLALGTDDVRIDGMHFVRGRVRGKGGALWCDATAPYFSNCVFAFNRTVKPERWAPAQLHETAHDGGAVFCTNGAAPRFEHCYFFDNATECGRGGALAADRGAAPRLVACVLANNRSGLDDPMRSSDGGALSFFDGSAGEVRGCVLAANTALARNDAGGLFVALWSAPRIVDNILVANVGTDDAGGLFIGGQEHRYGVPLDPFPPAEKFNVEVARNVFVGNVNTAKNSGAMRVTMESRVRLEDNLVAENEGGLYLQRSEVIAERNTVWQDWRFLEDKPSLGPSRLAGNILRGPLTGRVEARATLVRNMAEPAAGGTDLLPVADVFEADGTAGKIAGVRFDPATLTTAVTAAADLPNPGTWVGRLVGISQGKNAQWRVIKAVRGGREIVLWGRLEVETKPPTDFAVLRTFTLRSDAPAGVGARTK